MTSQTRTLTLDQARRIENPREKWLDGLILIGDLEDAQALQGTKTLHSDDCRMAFGRYDTAHCPRCLELSWGAEARRWG